ncbi:integrin alpha-2 [Paramormyrops kingsleyae]|uniref:Integrin subunit alpha 2 n=1 Tax=Paramormyrops kingsleyae TaxID=1676925 RepID=A0A3B3T521_9TELE|nr:integrin alpha-2 [Paramormyrops kingsleyae]
MSSTPSNSGACLHGGNMVFILRNRFVSLCILHSFVIQYSESFNIGTAGAKIFSGPVEEEFGYTVQQFKNYQGKWLLVGSPWSGYKANRKGDVYKCEIPGTKTICERLNLQNSVTISSVNNINTNMSLGLTLLAKNNGFLTCGPLWAQQCGKQYFNPGICTEVNSLFKAQPSFSPAIQSCGGPMDLVIVLDGSNSIWPWEPVLEFLNELLKTVDFGPSGTQVSVVQYAVDSAFQFRFNTYKTKDEMLAAAKNIKQMQGTSTNTFHAIDFARKEAFLPENGGRSGANKVLVVVTDGESHDSSMLEDVIVKCDQAKITRFGIAVLGYYLDNNMDTTKLVAEIKSIASKPEEKHFFNVSDETALLEIVGTLGDRIFNIEGTGKGGENFQMEMSQVGFSAHYSSKEEVLMLGAVGAYGWNGTVVHRTVQKFQIFPKNAFENVLEDRNHSSLLGYAVTTLVDESAEYYVAGAPRSNHTGQVVVYTVSSIGQPHVLNSQRGYQIGSYFGGVLCPLDVNKDGVTDLLLVGAPMFMSDQKKETGKVYIFTVTKGFISSDGSLEGPSQTENARFGMAVVCAQDLNQDGFNDVVVGAPLEDNNRGALYIFNGNQKSIKKQYTQKILGSELDPKMQYFGRSVNADGDLNDDTLPDVSVGTYGKVIQLWSRGVARVKTNVNFSPDKINIFNKPCTINGRKLFCFNTNICFSATFMPTTTKGPVAITYNLTLDMDLQSSRVSSRGLFSVNNERFLKKNLNVDKQDVCETHEVYVQEAPDFVNSLSLRVDLGLQDPKGNPVLDAFSPTASEFFIPFSKDCGDDDVCHNDLVLNVQMTDDLPSALLISQKNKRLSLDVSMENKMENAYNARVITRYSKSLFYASVSNPSDGTEIKCTDKDYTVSCQVGYPVLRTDQRAKFRINFDFNLNEMQNKIQVDLTAESDGIEETPENNKALISIPVMYDSEIILTRETSINFYVIDDHGTVKTLMNNTDDIGPEFNITLKVSTGNVKVGLTYLTVSLPDSTRAGNYLLYVTGVHTEPGNTVSCDLGSVVDPLKIRQKPHTVSFSHESFRRIESLDCTNAKCTKLKCVLTSMETKKDYFVHVTTRIWNGTFASSTFQSVKLILHAEMDTSQPDLLTLMHKKLPLEITIIKPGEVAPVPIGIIVGSVIGGLLLLAAVVLLLWKLGFFKKTKYDQLMKENADGEPQNGTAMENQA